MPRVSHMSKQAAAPALAVNVRDLLNQPGAHRHVVRRGPVPDLATPVAWVEAGTEATVDVDAVLPHDRVPLHAIARDAVVLAFPSAPLCRPDCAGLCHQSGAD